MDVLHTHGNTAVPADIPFTSDILEGSIRRLSSRFPFLRVGSAGRSVMGKKL
jgi:g-D-glutamyl-meso-diaminopimelate peptidase